MKELCEDVMEKKFQIQSNISKDSKNAKVDGMNWVRERTQSDKSCETC